MLKSNKIGWHYLLIAISIIAFWRLLFRYAVNVPWFDDVEVFPGAVVIWIKSSLWEGIKELFRPNNEHRMLPGKLAGVLCYELTGQLNMRWLILVANLNLMGILWLFWQFFKKQNLTPFYFLPVCLFLLQPQFYLTSHWSITAWQHQSVLFWGFFTVHLLSKNTQKSFFWAILTGFIATFSLSSGLFFWVAGAAVLLFQARYKNLLAWLVLMGVAAWLYFYGFNNAANNNGLAYFWQHPEESLFGFFTFFGGAFDFWQQLPILKRAILPTIMGFLLVSFCAWWFWGIIQQVFAQIKKPNLSKMLQPEQLFLVGCLVFLACNGSIIALLRPRFGYFVMLVGNYKIYPALLLAFGYLILITKTKNLRVLAIVLGFSLLFNVASYWKFTPEVAERRQMMLANAYNQQYNAIGLAAEIHSDFAKYIDYQMQYLTNHQAYFYPQIFDKKILEDTVGNGLMEIKITPSKNLIILENTTFEKGKEINDGAYLMLKSAKRMYLVACKQSVYVGKNPFKEAKGFITTIQAKNYKPDTYKVFVLEIAEKKQTVFKTNQQILINF